MKTLYTFISFSVFIDKQKDKSSITSDMRILMRFLGLNLEEQLIQSWGFSGSENTTRQSFIPSILCIQLWMLYAAIQIFSSCSHLQPYVNPSPTNHVMSNTTSFNYFSIGSQHCCHQTILYTSAPICPMMLSNAFNICSP